jgi:hypothetical protein
MPLSRFTHTLPPDFAEAMSESEAAPVGAALVEVFLGGAELAAGADVEAEELAGALGAIADLLAAGVAGGAELVVEAGAESLAAVLLFLLLLLVVALASAVGPLLAPLAGASAVFALFFLRLFLVVPVSELVLAPALGD